MNTNDKQILETAKAFLGSIDLRDQALIETADDCDRWRDAAMRQHEELHELKQAHQDLVEDHNKVLDSNTKLLSNNEKLKTRIEFLERKVARFAPKRKVTKKVRGKK